MAVTTAPKPSTVTVGCPECGAPIHVTIVTELAPSPEGRSHVPLTISTPDAADEIRKHIARGDCGRHPLPADG